MHDLMPRVPRLFPSLAPFATRTSAPQSAGRSLLRAGLSLALVALFTAPTSAQLPENVVVVGTVADTRVPGSSGLYFVTLPGSKSAAGAIRALTPLPKELTVPSSAGRGGCYSVLYRPCDGTLFVGDGAGPGAPYHVHILKVAGSIVVRARSVVVGRVPNVAGNYRYVAGLALLPDGRVVVAHAPVNPTGRRLAILDDKPTTPTLTTVNTTPLVGVFQFPWGLALSPDGRTAYVTSQDPNVFFPARLFSVDLTPTLNKKTTTVTPVLLHTWPKSVVPKLAADRTGVLFATQADPSSANAPAGTIEEIRISNNKATIKSIPISFKAALVGPALDRATGRFVFASALTPSTVKNNSVITSDRKGNLTVLTGPPTGGWGIPFAIDINDAFEPYGVTKTSDRHWFEEFPNPGGLPKVGSAKFSVTLVSKTAARGSFLLIGSARSEFPFFGITVLARPDIVLPVLPGTRTTIPLPIPNDASLYGARVLAQGVHVEQGGGWGATRGLDLSIQ